ncbi:MAG: hypothetical protein KJP23_06415 [Deltaproteobacteria bacterium]|nr:hypothetical protein [Deltaproteobacteria bacterium]
MQKSKTIDILKLLADGVHPVTGEQLDKNHLINEPDVIRALNTAVEALISEEKKIRRQRDLPERVGKPWSEQEDQALIKAFDSGISLNDLVDKHQRTRGAIRTRLVRLGKIDPDERLSK